MNGHTARIKRLCWAAVFGLLIVSAQGCYLFHGDYEKFILPVISADQKLGFFGWEPSKFWLNLDPPIVTAVDLESGRPLWHLRRSHLREAGWKSGAPMHLAADHLVVGVRRPDGVMGLLGIETRRGAIAWSVEDTGPAVAAGRVILTHAGDALDPATGRRLWSIKLIAHGGHFWWADADATRGTLAVVRQMPHNEKLELSNYNTDTGAVVATTDFDTNGGTCQMVTERDGLTVATILENAGAGVFEGRASLLVFDQSSGQARRVRSSSPWLVRYAGDWYFEASGHEYPACVNVRTGQRREIAAMTNCIPIPGSKSSVVAQYRDDKRLYLYDPEADRRTVILNDMSDYSSVSSVLRIDDDGRLTFAADYSYLVCLDTANARVSWQRAPSSYRRPMARWQNDLIGGAVYSDGTIETYDPANGVSRPTRRAK